MLDRTAATQDVDVWIAKGRVFAEVADEIIDLGSAGDDATYLEAALEQAQEDAVASRICSLCEGSGEGSYDGSRCPTCRGSGNGLRPFGARRST